MRRAGRGFNVERGTGVDGVGGIDTDLEEQARVAASGGRGIWRTPAGPASM